MIKYRVNNKFVDEETFYAELKTYFVIVPQKFSYEDTLERLKNNGGTCVLTKKGKNPWDDRYAYFDMADEQVFELEQIVADNEYDPLDDDAFAVAFAIFQNGFRRN